jgi:hypothetical protein
MTVLTWRISSSSTALSGDNPVLASVNEEGDQEPAQV